ncbi:hypothetical protein Pfo_007897 [Paulownia fortunei]|nr:hypothetical protein Pfo_007897 [Paulownia fortunei]
MTWLSKLGPCSRTPLKRLDFMNSQGRILDGCTSGSHGGSFWTICPYCYHVYEYEKKFEDCCLRCANERCRRGFHAVALASPPPAEVVEKGQYLCPRFMPFGLGKNNGEENVKNLWVPFATPVGSTSRGCDLEDDCKSEGHVIDISDHESADTDEAEKMEFQDHGNGKKSKINGEASNNGELKNANGEKSEIRVGNDSGIMENSVKEMGQRRKNSEPWNSKKLPVRGFRTDRNQTLSGNGNGGEGHSNVDGNEELEPGFGGERSDDIESVEEFFEGDDDIFGGLR